MELPDSNALNTTGSLQESNQENIQSGRNYEEWCDLMLKYIVHDEDRNMQYTRRAVIYLVKKLMNKGNSLESLVNTLHQRGKYPSNCIIIERTSDGKVQILGIKDSVNYIFAKIWRWPNLDKKELASVQYCKYGNESKLDTVCVNPYHYYRPNERPPSDPNRTVQSSLPSTSNQFHNMGEHVNTVMNPFSVQSLMVQPLPAQLINQPALMQPHNLYRPLPPNGLPLPYPYFPPNNQPHERRVFTNFNNQRNSSSHILALHHRLPMPLNQPDPNPHYMAIVPPTSSQPITPIVQNVNLLPSNQLLHDISNPTKDLSTHPNAMLPIPCSSTPPMDLSSNPKATLSLPCASTPPIDLSSNTNAILSSQCSVTPPMDLSFNTKLSSLPCPLSPTNELSDNPSAVSSLPNPTSPTNELTENPNAASSIPQPAIPMDELSDNSNTAPPIPLATVPTNELSDNPSAASSLPYPTNPTEDMLHNPHSVSPLPCPEYWASIKYYELTQQVGETFKIPWNIVSVLVDGFVAPSEETRLSLGYLMNLNRNEEIESRRREIGRGIQLWLHNEGDVFVEVLSRTAIFVNSWHLNLQTPQYTGNLIHKVFPKVSVQIFHLKRLYDEMKTLVYELKAKQESVQTDNVSSTSDDAATAMDINDETFLNLKSKLESLCHVRLSFSEGWGPDRPLSAIEGTPCWIEITLHRAQQLLDDLMKNLN